MCWYEEYEYYIEEDESYSTMDSIFNDIKKTFYEKLKSDVKQKIKELEDNNKWLNTRVNELNQELRRYKDKENSIKLEVSRARLDNLFKELGMVNVLYSISWIGSYVKKCDKCNNDRKIHYKTPRGKDAYELCECGEYKKMYYSVENELVRFCKNTWRSDKEIHPMFFWFKETDCAKDEYSMERYVKHIYNNEPYEELFEKYGEYGNGLFFKSKEECQGYCDWLGKKFGWTDDMIYDLKGNEIKR